MVSSFGGMGFGVTFGMANKDMYIVLNHFTMKKLIENKEGHLDFGADLGFPFGKGVSVVPF